MNIVPKKCMYCEEPEFGPGVTEPLCERHLELTIFIWRLGKRGEEVTAENIVEYMKRVQAPVAIKASEVPGLLAQMQVTELVEA